MSGLRSASSASAPTGADWQDLLARFPRATPELLVDRELRRRTDSKFLLSPAAASDLLQRMTGDYALLTAGGELLASYRTLYFDTPALDLFHAHRRGRRVRHKIRVRHYPDRRVTLLEIKTRRSELETSKVWRARDYGDCEFSQDDQAFVGAHTGIEHPVEPQVWTEFRRVTLLGLATPERVTLDLDLRVAMGHRARSLAGVAIVEVKQWPFRRHSPVMSALQAAGWRSGWASKYCAAIAFTRPDVPQHELQPGLRALTRGAA